MIYIHVHVCIHWTNYKTYPHIHIHVYIHTHTYVYNACMHICIHIHTHTYTWHIYTHFIHNTVTTCTYVYISSCTFYNVNDTLLYCSLHKVVCFTVLQGVCHINLYLHVQWHMDSHNDIVMQTQIYACNDA